MKITAAIKHGNQPFISISRKLAAWRILRMKGTSKITITPNGYYIHDTDETIKTPRFSPPHN